MTNTIVEKIHRQGHATTCFVYRYADGLIGMDRRGLCTCGLHNEKPQRILAMPDWEGDDSDDDETAPPSFNEPAGSGCEHESAKHG